MTDLWKSRIALAAVLVVAIGLGSRGITDEASGMLSGDMARYMMNGVFFYDLIRDGGAWSFDELTRYAELYYARYPALSLGHHPPLVSLALLPSFAVFGVSMFSARIVALGFFVLATWGLYSLANRFYGWQAASGAALLFVTNVVALRFGQYVFSEIPMVALVLAALNVLLRYCETNEKRHFTWFMLLAAASLYAKQLAGFIFPVYGVILVSRLGWRSLFRRHVLVMSIVGVVLAAPLAFMTWALAPANVGLAAMNASRLATGGRRMTVLDILDVILWTHLTVPVLLVVAAGAVMLVVRRDRLQPVVWTWLLVVIGGTVVFAGPYEPGRYAFAAMPAYFLVAAGLAASRGGWRTRLVGVVLLSAAVIYQAWHVRNVRPSGAGGYEAAAEYLVAHASAPVVLIDTAVDTGYLPFFVRRHDPTRRIVLLRADKLLAEGRVHERVPPPGAGDSERVYEVLRRFGIQLIAVEERKNGPLALQVLHRELTSSRFLERQRIPIETLEPRAAGVHLVIYEYKDAVQPDLGAELDIGLRLIPRRIKLHLRDLIAPDAK